MGVTVSHQYIHIYMYIYILYIYGDNIYILSPVKNAFLNEAKIVNEAWSFRERAQVDEHTEIKARQRGTPGKKGFGCLQQWGGDTTNISDHFLSFWTSLVFHGFPWWFRGKEPICQAEDTCSIPGSGRSPGEGNDNPLQYTCLKNPMDGGAWQVTIHGIVKEIRLSN